MAGKGKRQEKMERLFSYTTLHFLFSFAVTMVIFDAILLYCNLLPRIMKIIQSQEYKILPDDIFLEDKMENHACISYLDQLISYV